MMSTIPLHRQVIYIMLIAFVPLIFVTFRYINENDRIERLYARIDDNIQKAYLKQVKETPNRVLKQKFKAKDQLYLTKKLETRIPLEKESLLLQSLIIGRYHPEEDAIKRRVDFLLNGQNSLSFAEVSVKKYSGCTETLNTLAHPIEIDANDLVSIVSKIEGSSIDGQEPDPEKPHLIISDFKIERKKGYSSEIYVLNLQLIKREYTQQNE